MLILAIMDNFDLIKKSKSYKKFYDNFSCENKKISLTGITSSYAANIICAVSNDEQDSVCGGKCVYIASNALYATKFAEDLRFFIKNPEDILILAPYEYMLYDVESKSSELSAQRVDVLYRLLQGNWKILITTPVAVAQWFPNPQYIKNSGIKIKTGEIIEIDDLAKKLSSIRYMRLSEIDGKGQFAVRGDIVDIFPYGAENPVRIEFFDNEIDSVRIFDILSQRTIEKTGEVLILPDNETYIWDWDHADRVRNDILRDLGFMNLKETSSLYNRVNSDVDKMLPRNIFQGYDRYLPYILDNRYTIFDYTGKCHVFLEDLNGFNESINSTKDDYIRICETIQDSIGVLAKTYDIMMDALQTEMVCEESSYNIIYVDKFLADRKNCEIIEFPCRSTDPFGGNLQMLLDSIQEMVENKYETVLVTDSEGKKNRFLALQEENSIPKTVKIMVSKHGLSSGFICDDVKFAVFSDDSLFKRERVAARKKLKGKPISNFAEIEPGDLVVHEVHGVGRFEKIETVEIDGIRRDYIKINYRDDGVLYVPTPQLDSIQKYIGPDGINPKLNKLGSAEWNRTTAKVKESLRTYAKELVELYARRSKIKGHAYSRDTVWQNEFEEYFPYDETDDQLRCTEEIKEDLEKNHPMERLLCGDVGYGKTEVALRAAFKVVCEGKQVAFLVPTTVLAQQHYKNFVERFKKFPVKIDYLCRFRTTAEKKKILNDLETGKIDILVGTHSIIKGNVKFKDLGLVVIDEEQRFGVMHKEKLKKDRPDVDILTLSATPIPRTLHMSLSGIRDISLLEEPPQNRHPVQTYVAEWEPAMIKNAVYREMGRKGQVFYLYNKVKSIDEKKRQLQELIPEARIIVGHGQMGERELEAVIESFYKGEYDILLCTTIIESGIDMPNVNTIIVEESDHMGLAQLYQIRGRVGRSGKTAYAYITYKKDKTLNENAEKRLRTIRDFTEFGSGFKIALRDLEIRGAGSVLGERQHGQLAIVGYDTYCRLLSEVVEEETGQIPEEKIQVSVSFQINGYIGSDYIANEEARLDIYQKISRVETENDEYEINDELIDRYGDIPKSVENLIKISRIRYLCSKAGISSVIEKNGSVEFITTAESKAFYSVIQNITTGTEFRSKYGSKIKFVASDEPYLMYKLSGKNKLQEVLVFVEDILKFYHCKK